VLSGVDPDQIQPPTLRNKESETHSLEL
jgi:hypothetical protein